MAWVHLYSVSHMRRTATDTTIHASQSSSARVPRDYALRASVRQTGRSRDMAPSHGFAPWDESARCGPS